MLRLEQFFDVRFNDKYFCRHPCTEDKHIIIKAASGKTTQRNRILINNRGNDLFVTFTNLKKSDANTYYCGVERKGLDLWIKVVLEVTDAASYGPTPETVDTFTTLSSSVSNSSTLPSNSSDNITDVSASNTTLNTPTPSPPATQAAALSFVEMKILNTRGCVGERVTFKCSDWNNFFDVRFNDKYFCRSPCTEDKHIIIKAASGKTTQRNRILINNKGNDLLVTFTNLKKSDANTYYCGVERKGLDLWIKVVLKVTDAASYGPTPETVDTFTTLSSSVSNSSTLPSNSSDNITDVSASNTTTTTTTPPATQAAGSIPYLIIGVILLITLLMVLLKFMSKKMMKQRKVVSTAVMPQEDAREDIA
ncbi:hypothetical protein JOQ06_026243 [Pogonophryne albipinna]|uniref:Immunoglobulin V-set domain-containing protein n=1 Tax=Pogonophryne albipinna TaxID=1090488 RepID=A0AAD6A697_9TELE|nr:hypothetical protein JOQ06_026243 [Pogonophryne albipinna]